MVRPESPQIDQRPIVGQGNAESAGPALQLQNIEGTEHGVRSTEPPGCLVFLIME